MPLFLFNYTNRIDKKGRVSFPPAFRQVLAAKRIDSVVVYPSLSEHPCLEGATRERILALSESIDAMNPLDETREDFAHAILGVARELSLDGEGRLAAPMDLCQAIGVTDELTFVGQGETFQIWAPEAYRARADAALARVRARKGALPWPKAETGS